jgi:hypothetical protein
MPAARNHTSRRTKGKILEEEDDGALKARATSATPYTLQQQRQRLQEKQKRYAQRMFCFFPPHIGLPASPWQRRLNTRRNSSKDRASTRSNGYHSMTGLIMIGKMSRWMRWTPVLLMSKKPSQRIWRTLMSWERDISKILLISFVFLEINHSAPAVPMAALVAIASSEKTKPGRAFSPH